MPEIIFDNCVLSNFALSDSLYIIKKLYADTAYITDFVTAENIRGILKGHKNLIKIKEAVKDGWLKEVVLEGTKEKELFESLLVSLGSGEASSIAVAKTRGFVFACDDNAARKEAVSLGVKLTGTIGILVKSVRKKVIERKEADVILRKMIKYGFYSPTTSIKKLL
jgi:predicted nucleic acid-binding protein